MGVKRPMGLGKKAKQKKQKTVNDNESAAKVESDQVADELTVELDEEVNPDDPLNQLNGLFTTWLNSDKSNELILNGIIHECDRILRNLEKENITLTSWFYCIYSTSLADLALFNVEFDDGEEEEGEKTAKEEEEDKVTIKDYFENALERLEDGLERFPNSYDLLLTKSKILLNRIPLEYISKLTPDSTKDDIKGVNLYKLLKSAVESYESGIKSIKADENQDISIKDKFLSEILDSYDDLLEIVDNFGKENVEGEDSDDENSDDEREEEEEDDDLEILEEVELSSSHPLFKIQRDDSLNHFWREQMIYLHELISSRKQKDEKLSIEVSKKLGQSYLMEAEEPISMFMSLKYGSGEEEDEEDEEDGKAPVDEEILEEIEETRRISIDLVSSAMKYLKQANDKEVPQSWVDLAESEIQMGNLYDSDSKDQEKWYNLAIEKLTKANNATHGKYEGILNDLLSK